MVGPFSAWGGAISVIGLPWGGGCVVGGIDRLWDLRGVRGAAWILPGSTQAELTA